LKYSGVVVFAYVCIRIRVTKVTVKELRDVLYEWLNHCQVSAYTLTDGLPTDTLDIALLTAIRGFGFIKGESDELFFHNSEVEGGAFDSLREGQTVDYQVGQGNKGPCATAVTPV
jgi:CspA family cold shock protein